MKTHLGCGGASERIADFASGTGFTLDQFQRQAMTSLCRGRSVVVAAPTGSGKTLVAEFAVALALDRGYRAIYTSPLKALSNQKFGDLSSTYGSEKVGLLTGDHSIRGQAPIVVMTTEVLRNMLYADPEALRDVGVVVLDEVHYLQDQYRGGVWEEVIIHLPEAVALVCLSATISNAGEFGDWITAAHGSVEVVVEHKRPVPLRHLYCIASRDHLWQLPLLSDDTAAPLHPDVVRLEQARQGSARWRGGLLPPRRRDVIMRLSKENLLPAIYFIFSRAGCQRAASQLLSDGIHLTSKAQRKEIAQIAASHTKGISEEDLDLLEYDRLIASLQAGIAVHHAGMVPVFKEVVEAAFTAGLVKVVFATETLSLGINMPARTVVVEKLTKFNGQRHELLTPGQYTQLAGRAGRRGIDKEGTTVVLWSSHVPSWQVAELASICTYPLLSSFRPTYNMAANLVFRFDRDAAHHVVNSSFAQFCSDRSIVRLERDAERLRRAALRYRQRGSDAPHSTDRDRWTARAENAGRRAKRLERHIERRAAAMSGRLDLLCEFLYELDYLQRSDDAAGDKRFDESDLGLTLTRKGELLRRTYGECDLVMAEAVTTSLFDDLDPAGLAAAVSVLTFEARRDGPMEPVPADKAVRRAIERTLDLGACLRKKEQQWGLVETRELDSGFAAQAYAWASGGSLEDVLALGVGAGDFVRNVKQLIDACRQIGDATCAASLNEDVGRIARQAVKRLWRGVVALDAVDAVDQ